MEIKEKVHGFEVRTKQYVQEVDGIVYELEHLQSKVTVIIVDNQDTKKAFLVGFRTIPEDSTGVFHILEHSVLNGSEKYPDRDTFVNMMKHSMAEFINAITYQDHTVYPFSTENEKDFMILMDMYMNAVFHPNLVKDRTIFEQEGWHIGHSDKKKLEISGVVYNEMKGVYSSLDKVMMYELFAQMFPDNSYRFVSGGNPDIIPELSYDKFVETYRKYYCASNCCIVLYGKMNIQQKLEYLDRNYLGKMSGKKGGIVTPFQKPVKRKKRTSYQMESFGDQGVFAACAYHIGETKERGKMLASFILFQALLGDNEAPLKKALMTSLDIPDVQYYIMDGIRQPYLAVTIKNVTECAAEQLENVLTKEAWKLYEEGINKEILTAAINRQEFWLREKGRYQPDGILCALDIAVGWTHGISAKSILEFEETIEEIRKKVDTGYFEELLKEVILENQYQAEVLMEPFKEKEVSFSLSLEDLGQKYEEADTIVRNEGCLTCLKHQIPTKGIEYLGYYFDLSHLLPDQVPYARLLSQLMGELATGKHSVEELVTEKNLWTGNINMYLESYTRKTETDKAKLKFVVDVSILEKNMQKGMELVEEILFDTWIENQELIKNKIRQIIVDMEQYFITSGDTAATIRCSAHYMMEGLLRERYAGICYYQFLCNLLEHFEEEYQNLVHTLIILRDDICTKAPLTIRYAGPERAFEAYIKEIKTGKLYNEKRNENEEWYRDTLLSGKSEAFIIPSQVSYVALGGRGTYTGKMVLLGRIISFDYLWNNVRVKGGAYGCRMSVDSNGSWMMSSYRDPNVGITNDVYRDTAGWVKTLKKDEEELDCDKIGTVAGYDRILKPYARAIRMDSWYFRQEERKKRQEIRTQILEVQEEELRNTSEELEVLVRNGVTCVLGNREKIEASSSEFQSVTVLMH